MSERFVVISGCSGGGKSTLLAELGARGHRIVEEPGRRIIEEERERGGRALPWVDMTAFLRRAIDLALDDLKSVAGYDGWVFFDRGLVDAAAALEAISDEVALRPLCIENRYFPSVFMAPPWPEIYKIHADRRHDLAAAVDEYERLMKAFPDLGYEVVPLPKLPPSRRADSVLAALERRVLGNG